MLVEAIPSVPEDGRATLARKYRESAATLDDARAGSFVALQYQPVIALESGAVRGLKAVLTGGPGEESIPLLLEKACVDARYWPGCRIAVEVAAREFASGAVLGRVDVALAASGLAPWLLQIELAETAASATPLAALRALRARGVGLVFAGFGAGAYDLKLLRRLPWTAVKLDADLVHGLPFDPSARRTSALLKAAHAAGLRSTADGLETLAQRDMLFRLGCEEAAGPLYSRPLPPERLAELLDYRLDTCSPRRRASETRDDRAVPYRSENPGAD